MDQDSEAAAQLEEIKNLCTGEKCEIDPKTLFTDEECPGIFCTKKPQITTFVMLSPCPLCLTLLKNRKT